MRPHAQQQVLLQRRNKLLHGRQLGGLLLPLQRLQTARQVGGGEQQQHMGEEDEGEAEGTKERTFGSSF